MGDQDQESPENRCRLPDIRGFGLCFNDVDMPQHLIQGIEKITMNDENGDQMASLNALSTYEMEFLENMNNTS